MLSIDVTFFTGCNRLSIKLSKVPRDPHVKEGTIKLHIGGIGKNGDAEEFGNMFREHTTVHQHHLMPNKEMFTAEK